MSLDPIRAHERACAVCGRKEWCETIMDLIARKDGFLSWEMELATIRAQQQRSEA